MHVAGSAAQSKSQQYLQNPDYLPAATICAYDFQSLEISQRPRIRDGTSHPNPPLPLIQDGGPQLTSPCMYMTFPMNVFDKDPLCSKSYIWLQDVRSTGSAQNVSLHHLPADSLGSFELPAFEGLRLNNVRWCLLTHAIQMHPGYPLADGAVTRCPHPECYASFEATVWPTERRSTGPSTHCLGGEKISIANRV